MSEELRSSLVKRLPEARVLGVWTEDGPDIFGVPGARSYVLYAASASELNGLRHWHAEVCWYEGERFVSAFEASVFCRMVLQNHPLVWRILANKPSWWLPTAPEFPVDTDHISVERIEFDTLSDWLNFVRRLLTQC